MSEFLNILIIEDSPTDADLLVRSLREGLSTPFEYDLVARLDDAQARIKNDSIGLIVTDLNLPDSSGLETFQQLYKHAGDIPIVILSGVEDLELATESMRQGAQDFVVKGAAAAESLVKVIRFAIERSRRIQAERERDQVTHDLEVAHIIQRSLYPANGLAIPGFEIDGAVFSADRACGDYYDFFPIPGNRYAIVLGDICGHGLSAALMMIQVRACLRLLAKGGAPPDEVLYGVNNGILHDDPEKRRFASLFYGQLDPAARTFTFASAGHRGYLLKPDGAAEFLESTSMVVGLFPNLQSTKPQTIPLNSNDLLFVPTDGFQETLCAKHHLFGEQRTLDLVHKLRNQAAAEMITNLHSVVREYAGDTDQQDDMTAVAVKVL